MKSIVEVSSRGEVRYEMPDDIFQVVQHGLRWSGYRTVKAVVAGLPRALREQVQIFAQCLPIEAGQPVRGLRVNVMMLDDDSGSWDSLYQQEPAPHKVPDKKGATIFQDRVELRK